MNLAVKFALVFCWGWASHYSRPVVVQAISAPDTRRLASYIVGTLALIPAVCLFWHELHEIGGIRRLLAAHVLADSAFGLGLGAHYVVEGGQE
jgi:hypothetical protein